MIYIVYLQYIYIGTSLNAMTREFVICDKIYRCVIYTAENLIENLVCNLHRDQKEIHEHIYNALKFKLFLTKEFKLKLKSMVLWYITQYTI